MGERGGNDDSIGALEWDFEEIGSCRNNGGRGRRGGSNGTEGEDDWIFLNGL
jgi:hypothetical protein